MARTKYTAEYYRTALVGSGEYKGLRSYAKGFDVKDGYSLRDIDKWTAAQKRKVREYAKAVESLRARGGVVYRSRSDANLRKAQEAGRHPETLKQLKVAFIPGAFKPGDKPRIRIGESGVTVSSKQFDKVFLPFDKTRLLRDTEGEILRIGDEAAAMNLHHFVLVTGEHNLGVVYHDLESVYEAVNRLMHQYDGRKPIPAGSGNAGDAPKKHHWKIWLKGVDAYHFGGGGNSKKLLRDMEAARAQRRRERDAQRQALKRAAQQTTARGKRASKTKGKR